MKGKNFMIIKPLLRTEEFFCKNPAEKYIYDCETFKKNEQLAKELPNCKEYRIVENIRNVDEKNQVVLASCFIIKWSLNLQSILEKYNFNNGELVSCYEDKIVVHLGYSAMNKNGSLKKNTSEIQKDIVILNPLSENPVGLDNLSNQSINTGVYVIRSDYSIVLESLNFYRGIYDKMALTSKNKLKNRQIFSKIPDIEETPGKSLPHWFNWINQLKEGQSIRVHRKVYPVKNLNDICEKFKIIKKTGTKLETEITLDNSVLLKVDPGFIPYEGIEKSFGLIGENNDKLKFYVSEYDYDYDYLPCIAVDSYHGGKINLLVDKANIKRFIKGQPAYTFKNINKEIYNFTMNNQDKIISKIDKIKLESVFKLADLDKNLSETISIQGGYKKEIHRIHIGDECFLTTIEVDCNNGLTYRFSFYKNDEQIKKWWKFNVLNDLGRWCL